MLRGEVGLTGARLGGDLDCTGPVLDQPDGDALKLNRTIHRRRFFPRHGATVNGMLNLTTVTIGAIYDDQACWPANGDLLLNRCRYGAFIGGPVDAASRLEWLARQNPERRGRISGHSPMNSSLPCFGR
jgi:hypothetical protein